VVEYNKFSSHLPALTLGVLKTSKPVLELGSGLGSTKVLRNLVRGGRKIVTIETDPCWYEVMYPEIGETRDHHYILINDLCLDHIEKITPLSGWGVIFVDHKTPDERVDLAREIIKEIKFDLLICHDTDYPKYREMNIFEDLKYSKTIDWIDPWTSIGSNTMTMDFLNLKGQE
jgi:hypothetical protein